MQQRNEAGDKEGAKSVAFDWINENRRALSDWNQVIWHYAEPALREYKSAAWYVDRLSREGFKVEAGSGGMPTAFSATFENGSGPVIAAYAEYDAVPGNCQVAAARKGPRPGLSKYAAGHTDPHSALGIAALGGALAAEAAMQRHNIKGTLRFFGEPAEKLRLSKPVHAAKGYYDGIDAALSFHPTYMLPLCNTVRWDTHCGAAYAMVYRFICDEPERWGKGDGAPIPQSHSAVRAPGANDALMMIYMSSKALRDSMLPHQGGWSISEAILTAGEATADNLPAGLAEIQYMIRVPTIAMAEQVTSVLDANAEAAARMTGCRYERHWVSKSRPGLANHAIARVAYESLATVGPPRWDESAKAIAREIQVNSGGEAFDEPFIEECERLIKPEEAEEILRRDLPPSQVNSTSDDYTDMTWHAPTARIYVARPALKAANGFACPSWAMNALGGIPETIDPMVVCAAKTVALTALRLLEDGGAREEARREFVTRTGGGIGGEKWIAPLCDYEPPIHFRWPEYVTTARGREWWIPTFPKA
jgi:aminobenzoyl-glutamate utilization protein B